MSPLTLWTGEVLPDWLDYNCHMTEHRYLQVFGETSDALYGHLGIDFDHAERGAYYTLQTHLTHLSEGHPGSLIRTETEVLGYDEKRIHLLHSLFDNKDVLLATGEHLVLHVAFSRACAAGSAILARLAKIYHKQADRPAPAGVGSVLKKPLSVSRRVGGDPPTSKDP